MEIPEFFQGNYCSQISAEMHHSVDSSKSMNDHFIVEELLDFSNEDDAVLTDCGGAAAAFDNVTGNNSSESSTVTVVDSCHSGCEPTFTGDNAGHFSSDLCVPYDDLAELEWVSNFVEESFSCEDMQKLQLISGMKAGRSDESSETRQFHTGNDIVIDNDSNSIDGSNTIFNPEMAVPGKARSKRSRAAPCNWASRLLMLSPTTSSLSEITTTEGIIPTVGPTLPSPVHSKKSGRGTGGGSSKKKDSGDEGNNNVEGRKCLHCATDKTPQWRTGPMGPKTLCNACGVRYKSGRLVPEYRPAASPTFVLTKHSNSHRKVLELRRQKEMQRAQQQQQPFMHHHQLHQHHHLHQNVMFDLSNGDDYLIHGHGGPDFRQLI